MGKTTLIKQFLSQQFIEKYKETIEDLYVADYDLSTGEMLRLEILDTNGAFQFPAMHRLAISNSHAFLLVYSSGNMESWIEIEKLRRQVRIEIYPNFFCLLLQYIYFSVYNFCVW